MFMVTIMVHFMSELYEAWWPWPCDHKRYWNWNYVILLFVSHTDGRNKLILCLWLSALESLSPMWLTLLSSWKFVTMTMTEVITEFTFTILLHQLIQKHCFSLRSYSTFSVSALWSLLTTLHWRVERHFVYQLGVSNLDLWPLNCASYVIFSSGNNSTKFVNFTLIHYSWSICCWTTKWPCDLLTSNLIMLHVMANLTIHFWAFYNFSQDRARQGTDDQTDRVECTMSSYRDGRKTITNHIKFTR